MANTLDRNKVKALRVEMESALKALGEKHGLAFTVGRITFDESSFKATVEAGLTDNPGEPKMAVDFRNMCFKYGLKPSNLGNTFESNGTRYEIVGLKPRNRKYPIIARHMGNGKQYKFSSITVKASLLR